ncbi:MAG: undecaprenyl-diphosphate phosphatase [Rhodospirillaceae bacterium]|nr:undecaprenyl-diphosphate phosphatase [Rhodospirillaceae bacterium]
MPLIHLIILALIQGLTEFLPISSSGHLILIPNLLKWPDQGIIIDVAVHAGSLIAVLIYLWKDIGTMFIELKSFRKPSENLNHPMIFLIFIASVPVMISGLIISLTLDDLSRNIELIGWATLVFGILLGVSDRYGMTLSGIKHMKYGDAIVIGFGQTLALIPGASRAGVCITAARFLGFERSAAARFSLLLAIPAILGASTLKGTEILISKDITLGQEFLIAMGISFCAALASISIMMAWLNKAGFTPFVIYRILLGSGLLLWCYL